MPSQRHSFCSGSACAAALLAAQLLTALPCAAGDIYVSPRGCDTATGTSQSPLASVQRALRMAREWRRTADARCVGGITIHLAGGVTFAIDEPLLLKPEDSGTPDSPTVIMSDGPAATLSGGVVAARGTREATLGGGLTVRRGPRAAVFRLPTFGGRPLLTRSLWAVSGDSVHKLYCASHLGEGRMEPMLAFDAATETITIPSSSLTRFGIRTVADAPQLTMTVHQRWATALLRVRNITIKGDSARLTFLQPESRWEFAHPWPQPVVEDGRMLSSFALAGARQFLDDKGEWWQDYRSGDIYAADTTVDTVIVPRLNRLVTVIGCEGERVHDITFQNVAFAFAAWQRPMECGHVTLQGGFPIAEAYKLTEHEGLPWDSGLENQAWITRPESAVRVEWGERVNFRDCRFTHLAATALDYTAGCRDMTVRGCTFTDIGGTALMAGSFLEGATEVHRPQGLRVDGQRYTPVMTERINISGNTVTDATNEDWGAVGIALGIVRDATIEGNTVSGVNYSGICVGWGWTPEDVGMCRNRIVGNRVSDYARQLYDAGGIYTMSAQPSSLIEGNTVSAPHDAPYATNRRAFPIYFDARTDGYTVRRNTLTVTPQHPEKYGYNHPGAAMNIEN